MKYAITISKRPKGEYLTIAQKYWDPNKKQAAKHHVKSLGYLSDLQKLHADPIAYYKAEVARMNAEIETDKKQVLTIQLDQEMDAGTNERFNFGYAIILQIYYELELDRFFNNKARHEGFQYNTNSIMTMLIISRILKPGSKIKAFEDKLRYFERFNFKLHDVYRSLTHFSAIGDDCQKYLSDQITEKYGRDTHFMYFDVTNFYYEIDEEDDLRMYGKSKEGRHDPITQLALAMDADGLPLYYKLFPGNTHDTMTFRDVFSQVSRKYNPGRMIAVADMGVTSSDNIYYLKGGDHDTAKNGYVFSYSIAKADHKFKEYVLDASGYTDINNKPLDKNANFKIKSRVDVRTISVTMKGKNPRSKPASNTEVSDEDTYLKKFKIDEKQIVFWSRKYADKAAAERAKMIESAKKVIANPKTIEKSDLHKLSKYIKNITFDQSTGEVIDKPGKIFLLNEERIAEDAKYDGYYCLITSELDMEDSKAIEIYRGLWEIEECFRIEKSELEIRPVYVSKKEHVNAHILTCFISLVVMRLIQKKTNHHFSIEQIINCLNRISCSFVTNDCYVFDYCSEESIEIGDTFGINFRKKIMLRGEIKNVLASQKKNNVSNLDDAGEPS